MNSLLQSPAVTLPPDRRQSETALAIARGTARFLASLGFSCVTEVTLPSGRRADLVAMSERGDIWIVEIKSSLEDLRADQKWQDYRAHCDRLFFAFTQDLPCEVFPNDTGLLAGHSYRVRQLRAHRIGKCYVRHHSVAKKRVHAMTRPVDELIDNYEFPWLVLFF